MDKFNLFENLLNFLKKTGSSGSQFSINPTISNEQIGDSVKQITNAGLPTAITPSPISPFGINSILRGGKIDDIVADSIPGEVPDFSKAMTRDRKRKKERRRSGSIPTEITDDSKKDSLDKYGDLLKGLSDDQIEAAFKMKGIELAGKFGEGGMRAADSYDNLTRSIAAMPLPQYRAPNLPINPMIYMDYSSLLRKG